MFAEERRREIIRLLSENKKVTVKELSKVFQVSEVIIRKDLNRLEEESYLERTHGGAILKKKIAVESSINAGKFENMSNKKEIAEKVYKEIEDKDVIFLDTSNINILVASFIMENPKDITVITNMLQIIKMLAGLKSIKLISIGGSYETEHDYFIGGIAVDAIKKLNVDKLFMGAEGINVFKGTISDNSVEDGFLKTNMMEISKKVYLLAEHKKFGIDALYNFGSIKDVDSIIVDNTLEKNIIEILNKNKIEII